MGYCIALWYYKLVPGCRIGVLYSTLVLGVGLGYCIALWYYKLVPGCRIGVLYSTLVL